MKVARARKMFDGNTIDLAKGARCAPLLDTPGAWRFPASSRISTIQTRGRLIAIQGSVPASPETPKFAPRSFTPFAVKLSP